MLVWPDLPSVENNPATVVLIAGVEVGLGAVVVAHVQRHLGVLRNKQVSNKQARIYLIFYYQETFKLVLTLQSTKV